MPSFLRRSVRAKILALVLATALGALLVNAAALLYYDVSLGIVALAIVAGLAAALLVGGWLQRALTRPILAVTNPARAVLDRSDYTRRARKSTEDEIGVLADAFNRMLERLDADNALRLADRRKDEFLATLAHELRNPLAPIRNALYLMQTSPNDAEVNANARAMIERQLHQLMRLVDDLLDVSRVATGKLALRRERVELRSVAQNAIEAVDAMLHARGHALEVELPPAGVYVNADPTRLAQVFIHLLQNAGKFTERGGRIDFSVGLQAGELVATVRENGVGVAPEMREEIFEMFSQADRSLERNTMGLGVGLSLSRRLVELHGGSIEVKSEGSGRGAQFTVRIPVLHTDIGRERPTAPTALSRAGARHRILLADDNRDFAVSLAALLRGMGNEVRVEHDGAAALGAAEDFRPDLAFLDIGLPKLNGFDLARKLRELNPGRVQLVAVTGWGQEADRKLAREAGFDDYIVKPIELDKLQSLLNSNSGSGS